MGRYKLSDVFTLQMGKTPSRSNADYWNNGDNNWVSISDMSTYSKYVDLTKETISDEGVKGSGIKAVPPDTVILSFKLSLGKVAITTQPTYTNEAIMAFIDRNIVEISPDYVFYLFSWMDWAAGTNKAVKGITLNKATLEAYEINIPPLSIQQKIADILDRANDLIEKRKAQIEKLDLLVKSQFVAMFGDPVTNPMGWEVRRLAEIFKVRSSKRVYQHEQTIEGVPFLRVSDLTSRIIEGIDSCSLYISNQLFDTYKKAGYVPKVSDILVTSRGTLGLCYIIQDTDEFYFQDGMISWLNRQKIDVSPEYILFLFCTDGIKRQIEKASAGSTVGYLSLANLEALHVMFPPYALQTHFAAFVERVEAQKAQLKKSLALLELNYKSLMQKCFNGEMGDEKSDKI